MCAQISHEFIGGRFVDFVEPVDKEEKAAHAHEVFKEGLVEDIRERHEFSSPGVGRGLLLLTSVGVSGAGLTIMTVGMTSVFVPQDLEFMGVTREVISAINPHLVPLIAHDRAGFGGALVSFGLAMFACVRYARQSRALWQALTIAGAVGFGTAIGVHPAIGYLSFSHLGPAVLGCVVFAAGLALARREERG